MRTYGEGAVTALNGTGAALARGFVAGDEFGGCGDRKDGEGKHGGESGEHCELVWFGLERRLVCGV